MTFVCSHTAVNLLASGFGQRVRRTLEIMNWKSAPSTVTQSAGKRNIQYEELSLMKIKRVAPTKYAKAPIPMTTVPFMREAKYCPI